MKIEFEEKDIELRTEGLLEQLYLERLGLKHEGDIAKCVVSYEGSYIALEIRKATVKEKEDKEI